MKQLQYLLYAFFFYFENPISVRNKRPFLPERLKPCKYFVLCEPCMLDTVFHVAWAQVVAGRLVPEHIINTHYISI